MNTCKATLRVLFAHRVYLMIYLVFIGILMMSISWAMLTSASGSMSAVFESTKTRVAIIDRDSDRGDIATSMRAYLRDSSELVDLDDTSETLQQAVASNWVDLIVIIPDGFADDYVAAAADGDNPPNVDTVTSYASGSGSMARMNVGGFLSLTRTALIGAQTTVDQAALAGMMNATGGAAGFDGASLDQDMLDSLPEGQVDKPDIKDLSQAAKMAAESASDTDVNHQVAVVDTPTEESASAADTAVSGFGGTMKTALYPLSLAMTICGSMILGAFTTGEVRRRLTASPRRMALMGLQRLLTLGGFALVVCVGYLVLSIGLMMAAGLDPLHLSVGGVLMTFGATCVYALMTVACGFMLSEFGLSEEAANGFANIFGLLIMFTSGVTLPIDNDARRDGDHSQVPARLVVLHRDRQRARLRHGGGNRHKRRRLGRLAGIGRTVRRDVHLHRPGRRPLPPIPSHPGRARHHAAGRVRKSAFQPIPLYRVVGELDSGDPPFLHQLAHTGCGGQRRQLQFAHDLLDAHRRMPLQYGHNRLDHVARRTVRHRALLGDGHRERVDVVARGRRLDAGLAQRGGDALVAVAAFWVHKPAARIRRGLQQREQELVSGGDERRARHRMRTRQHIMCHHAVQATRIGDLDAIGEHADMHLRAARIGRIITVGERVRNRLAQHEWRIIGLLRANPTHQRVDRIVDHHRNRTDHRLRGDQSFVTPEHIVPARPRKHGNRNAEPRIELLRIAAQRQQSGQGGAQDSADLRLVGIIMAQHLQIQQHIDAVPVGEHARMLFAHACQQSGNKLRVEVIGRGAGHDIQIVVGCRCSSMSRSTS